MFGVYIQKDNASGGCYKVGKVWKDLRMLMTSEISESYSAPAQASEVKYFQDYDLYFLKVRNLINLDLAERVV